jgi:ribonuclease Z
MTHSHLDHSFHLPFYLNTHIHVDVYGPKTVEPFVKNFLQSVHELNVMSHEYPTKVKMNFNGVKGGDVISMNKSSDTQNKTQFKKFQYQVKIVDCVHSVPTVGYCFSEFRSKLKSEYKGLQGSEIAKLHKQGVEIQETVLEPIFAFMGDTTPKVFEKHPEILQ